MKDLGNGGTAAVFVVRIILGTIPCGPPIGGDHGLGGKESTNVHNMIQKLLLRLGGNTPLGPLQKFGIQDHGHGPSAHGIQFGGQSGF